ncbi:predicted protein [Postia placenta Mad-698-R]|nr:predicted protein [Postia placenta Mad-698-R]
MDSDVLRDGSFFYVVTEPELCRLVPVELEDFGALNAALSWASTSGMGPVETEIYAAQYDEVPSRPRCLNVFFVCTNYVVKITSVELEASRHEPLCGWRLVLGVVVFLSFSYLIFQAVQYHREASAAAASEAKDLEASTITEPDTERKSCSISDDSPPPVTEEIYKPGPDEVVFDAQSAHDDRAVQEEPQSPAMAHQGLSLTNAVLGSPVTGTLDSSFGTPCTPSLAGSSSTASSASLASQSTGSLSPSCSSPGLVDMLLSALMSGDEERLAAAKAKLAYNPTDDEDWEADSDCAASLSSSPAREPSWVSVEVPSLSYTDSDSSCSADSPSVCLIDAASVHSVGAASTCSQDARPVYATETTKTGVPYLDFLLSLPPPPKYDTRVPRSPVAVKTKNVKPEPEPVFTSSASWRSSIDDFGAVGLAF